MFEPVEFPRVFALEPGVDFPRALVDGLRQRLAGAPPESMARTRLMVNTRRMARRIRDLFDQGPPCLLPRISLVTDLGEFGEIAHVPPPVPPLRRRLELARIIERLLQKQPDLAARASLFDLADSLSDLIDEMHGEGVDAQAIQALDVSDLSGHWERAQIFIGIANQLLEASDEGLDLQARQRRVVGELVRRWQAAPPAEPIILAGSTGSRGSTLMLMQAVAGLPQGAVVLPGFDFDQPARVWDGMNDALAAEDHPQFRFRKLLTRLEMAPSQVRRWAGNKPPSASRNRVVSLALRPAPVTDAWMAEGPDLPPLDDAMRNVTLVEADSPRTEALAIALRLRAAAETGQYAALITPDRMLTRQVSAALDRWRLVPDDSAGLPLHLSPPGRFLRHVAELFTTRLTGETLLELLKHPLCHDGDDRAGHLLRTRDLELHLRKNGPPFPTVDSLQRFAATTGCDPGWAGWVTGCFCDRQIAGRRPLADWIGELRALCERLSAGSVPGASGGIWERNAGQQALAIVRELADQAAHGGEMAARDFADLMAALLESEVVRDRDAPHGRIMIWGTLEARVQGADLLILAGLNEGSWPEAVRPDPWLNRRMRHDAGLLLPERRIGLSAHDFQQAIGAPEVWLTRSKRSDDAETVPSRWLNRLTNLLAGLPGRAGPAALDRMRQDGQLWLRRAAALESAPRVPAAIRPSPRPPAGARPRKLSVTEIKRLIRDPYAIYARHVLRLRPLDPLVRGPDALLRGIVVHEILEALISQARDDPGILTRQGFLDRAADLLERSVAWPTARALWLARLSRVADAFLQGEQARRATAVPLRLEAGMAITLEPHAFTLTGKADRIDRDDAGHLRIYDYKTGAPPTRAQQARFDKQLLIEAAVAERGGFSGIQAAPVAEAVFLGIGSSYKEVAAPLDDEPPEKVWAELGSLIAAYLDPAQGFTSRRAMHRDSDRGDYDQLARFGEWDHASVPEPEDLA